MGDTSVISCRLSRCAAFIFAGCAVSMGAQDAIQVDSATLSQHVDRRIEPIYPPIAWAGHVDGAVALEIRVGVSGKVEAAKVLNGPKMLQQAALDGVQQWTFHPFDNAGVPVAAIGQIAISFVRGDNYVASADDGGTGDASVAKHFFPLVDKCTRAIRAGKDSASIVSSCEEAAATAETFGPDCRYVEKRTAFVYAATAFTNAKDLQSALMWADKAVAVVNFGHDDGSGSEAAYSTRGTIEAMQGKLQLADQDLAAAEDFGRRQLAPAYWENPERKKEYAHSLAQDLRFHAKVLQALNNPKEAQDKLEEAARYQ
jgi:TonB family protein